MNIKIITNNRITPPETKTVEVKGTGEIFGFKVAVVKDRNQYRVYDYKTGMWLSCNSYKTIKGSIFAEGEYLTRKAGGEDKLREAWKKARDMAYEKNGIVNNIYENTCG